MESASTRLKSRVFRIVAVSCVLQLAGFVSPGWIITVSRDTDGRFNKRTSSGVWYTVGCYGGENGHCVIDSLVDVVNGWTTSQILTSLAILATMVYFVIPEVRSDPITNGEIRRTLGIILMLLTGGILSLTSTGLVATEIIILMAWRDNYTYYFPPSLFLFAVGGALLIIVCVLMFSDVLTRINSAYKFRNSDHLVPAPSANPVLPPYTQQPTHAVQPAYVQQSTSPTPPAQQSTYPVVPVTSVATYNKGFQ